MTKMTAWDRRVLRRMALATWEQSTRLYRDAVVLRAESSWLREYSRDRRAARELQRQADEGTRAGGVGLVTSSDVASLIHLEQLVVHHVPVLVGAQDADALLEFAVICQPDVAIVDGELAHACREDLALTLALYAPLTKVLWLTDDDWVAVQARTVGFDAVPHEADERAVLSWLALAAA